MTRIKIIKNPTEINLGDKWLDATKFKSKNRIVNANWETVAADYAGHKYQIISKKERPFSTLERFGRGLLGIAAIICSLTLVLFTRYSKQVKELFSKDKATIRFAILEKQSIVSEKQPKTPETKPIIPSASPLAQPSSPSTSPLAQPSSPSAIPSAQPSSPIATPLVQPSVAQESKQQQSGPLDSFEVADLNGEFNEKALRVATSLWETASREYEKERDLVKNEIAQVRALVDEYIGNAANTPLHNPEESPEKAEEKEESPDLSFLVDEDIEGQDPNASEDATEING